MVCRWCGANMFVADRCDSCGAGADGRASATSSSTWITLTWVLLAAMALYLVLAVYRLVAIFQVLGYVQSWDGTATNLDQTQSLRLADIEDTSAHLVAFGAGAYLILFAVWMRSLRRTVADIGGSVKEVTKHWAYIAWRVGALASLIFVLFTVTTKVPTGALGDIRDEVIAIEQHQMIYAWIRIPLAAVLAVAVVALYRRVRTLRTD